MLKKNDRGKAWWNGRVVPQNKLDAQTKGRKKTSKNKELQGNGNRYTDMRDKTLEGEGNEGELTYIIL